MAIVGQAEPSVLDTTYAAAVASSSTEPARQQVDEQDAPERPYVVGIVFVHGIGSQVAGETLLDWARPLIRAVWAWAEDAGAVVAPSATFRDPVEWAEIDLTGRSTPIVELEVPGVAAHRPQHWVMTEAWWAADVRPPTVGEMLGWLVFRRGVARIVAGILTGIRASTALVRGHPTEAGARGQRVRDALDATAIGTFLGLVAIAIAPVYLVLRALQALPIPALRDAISTAQLDWFLAEWFGDVRILLHDRAQAANLRSKLAKTIEKVNGYGADSIVIVGHSGGTIVSYMLLADRHHERHRVDKFISHGEAIGLAWLAGRQGLLPPADFDEGLRPGDRLLERIHRPRSDDGRLRWVDFHASHDPAPAFNAGRWGGRPDRPDVSNAIVNRMSVKNDHGGYWDNDEQFVIPLLRELDTPGRSATESRFHQDPVVDEERVRRRVSRVRELAWWWNAWMASLAAAIVGGLAIGIVDGRFGLAGVGRLVSGVLRDRPIVGGLADLAPLLLGAVAAIVLLWLLGLSGVSAWNALDDAERRVARRVQPAWPDRGGVRVAMAISMVAVLFGAAFALTAEPRLLAITIAIALGGRVPARVLERFGRLFAWVDGASGLHPTDPARAEGPTRA